MVTKLVSLVAVWVSVGLAARVASVPQGRDASGARSQTIRIPIGTAGLSGVVTDGATHRSVAGARVRLVGLAIAGRGMDRSTMPLERTAVTDDQGTFTIERLPTARVHVHVSRSGFLSTAYGASWPGGRGEAVRTEPGQVTRVAIALPRPGSVTGVARDEDGHPLTHGYVRASRVESSEGRRRLVGVHQALIDDTGSYRLFGLVPGEYLLSAVPAQGPDASLLMALEIETALRRARPAPDRSSNGVAFETAQFERPTGPPWSDTHHVRWLPTFYPSTTDVVHARLIRIGPGDAIAGLDFVGRREAPGTVRGQVLSLPGEGWSLRIAVVRDGDELEATKIFGMAGHDGRFVISGLATGWYTVFVHARQASSRPLESGPQPAGTAGRPVSTVDPPLWGRTRVFVESGAEATVTVPLALGRTVSGVVQFDGVAPTRPDTDATVILWRAPGSPWPDAREEARVDVDGAFTLTGVIPGRHYFQTSRGWIREVLVDGRDVQDDGLEVPEGGDMSGVRLTAVGRRSTLSGHLTDSRSDDAVDVGVLVFSTDSRYWTPDSRRVALTWPDLLGRYRIANLPTGEYFVSIVRDIGPLRTSDAEFLRRAAEGAVPVMLTEGADVVQNLRVTR